MVVAVMVSLVLGFLAGLLTFKIKVQWCPSCGETKCCIRCEGVSRGAPRPASEA